MTKLNGKKLALTGFIAQAVSEFLLGVLYLVDGGSFDAAIQAEISEELLGMSTAVTAMATALSLFSSLGCLLAAAGFFLLFLKERRTSDLILGSIMTVSVLSVFFSRYPTTVRSLAAWAYTAVMIFCALRRRYPLRVTLLLVLALLVLISGGTILELLDALGVSWPLQGLCSGVLMSFCHAAVILYILAKPVDKEKTV